MKGRISVSEAVELLDQVEHKRISETAIRQCLKRHGVEIGKDHKISTKALLDARKAGKVTDKAAGSGAVAEARVRKLNLECRRLEVEIEKLERTQERERKAKLARWLDGICRRCRSRFEAVRQHETAKHPQHREMIEAYFDKTLEIMLEMGREAEETDPAPEL